MAHFIVIGGANVDLDIKPSGPVESGDCVPGRIAWSPGGVARNLAENLANLNHQVRLVAPLADDHFGSFLLKSLEGKAIFDAIKVERTCVFASVRDSEGDGFFGVSDADFRLAEADVDARAERLSEADGVIVDANLDADILKRIATYASTMYADSISAAKAPRLQEVLHSLSALKTTRLELDSLQKENQAPAGALFGGALEWLFLTEGEGGAYAYRTQGGTRYLPAPSGRIGSAVGAGDAFFAGAIHALHEDLDPLLAGTAAAAINLRSNQAGGWMNEQTLQDEMRRISNESNADR